MTSEDRGPLVFGARARLTAEAAGRDAPLFDMTLTPAHRSLLLGQAAAGFFLNLALNGGLAWLTSSPDAPALPLWARGNCVAGDTIGTSFFLPLTTCLVLTYFMRRALRGGGVAPLARADLPGAVRWWPANSAARGAVIGLICALTIALATLAGLGAAGVESMTRGQIIVFKGIYTALLGLLVTPLFGLRALADNVTPEERR